ncbi:hypothetical protein QYE76_036331 [Lolium multiflorum]|uniref:Uncharacterized protein n=1 Tax=Lolium multiflorum TaxID=4521 RepID=A0AAD8R4Q2_LOLMU|nr:hypothetical protein QYE76_036331 [Lolium multiflorum]
MVRHQNPSVLVPLASSVHESAEKSYPGAAAQTTRGDARDEQQHRERPEVPLEIAMEPFTQTEFYQLGNGGGLIFERDLFALTEFLGRAPPEFFGGQVNDQPGGQLQCVIMADLHGKLTSLLTDRIQFSFRENNWVDGLARGMQEALARLHNSLGVPLNLPSHPQLRHHVEHLDFMLNEVHIDLDNSRAYANHTHIQLAQQAETIKVIAKECLTLRRLNLKKDSTINRLKAKIASLKATIETQAEQLRDLEGEGEGEDIQGDGYSYVSNDGDYEEEEDDNLVFHPYEDGHEHLTAGMDTTFPINVDGE